MNVLSTHRAFLAALLLVATGGLGACTSAVEFHNVQPRLTWAAVDPPEGEVAQLTVWVSDHEGDVVDLDIRWQAAGGDPAPIVLAPGGHGVVGLTTDLALFDPNGQPHAILWDTTDVPEGPISLRLVADDGSSGATLAVRTPTFTLVEGSPEPVALAAD